MALALLAVGLLTHASLTVSGHRQGRSNAERRLAWEGLRTQVARLRDWDLADCYTAFDDSSANDPPGAPGSDFDVPGLEPISGSVGRVLVPASPASDGSGAIVLREDLVQPAFGLPLDLDGDGVLDDQPKDTLYRRLPVRLEVRWRGVHGEQSLGMTTWLGELQ